ncbi:MAG: acyltransferase [Pseudomonadota bacterium]
MPKLVFAHQLRGVAALLIVITHYFGVYYGAQGVVAMVTVSPDLHFVAADWVRHMDFPVLKGPFGVAVFFLISGFVIPFSLQKNKQAGFLLARAFRIYPTYIACLAIGLLAVTCSSRYWNLPFAPDWMQMAANAGLVHNLLGIGTFDTINWTLAIEIKFYLLAAVCAPALLRSKPLVLAAIAAAVVGLNLLPAAAALSTDLNYILFMLIGVLFYQHYQGLIGTVRLAIGAVLLLGAFLLGWRLGTQHDQVPVLAEYYVYALLTFGLCYALRDRFRPLRVLDFFADISYPLYAVHPLVGYTLIKILMQRGLPFGAAVSLTLTCVVALAWLLHQTVETRSSGYGKKLAILLGRQPAYMK